MCDFFGGGGGGGTQKTTSSSAPWAPTVPGLKKGITDFTKLYDTGGLNLDYYPNPTVAPLAPERMQAWQMIADRARAGSPLTDAAKGYMGDTIGGKYLTADAPGFASMLQRAKDAVNANYATGSRYGSGAHDSALMDSVGDLTFRNYQTERGYQDKAAGMAPAFAAADYNDANQLAQVGTERQGYAQDLLTDDVNRWNWDEKKKINAIQLLRDFLTGTGGSQTTSTQPYQGSSSSPWAQLLGTGASLAGSYVGAGGTF